MNKIIEILTDIFVGLFTFYSINYLSSKEFFKITLDSQSKVIIALIVTAIFAECITVSFSRKRGKDE